MSKIVISIEGNIGVGKSSFISLLKEYLGDIAEYISEPVEEWLAIQDDNGKNLLQTFYDDKKRWGYTFQNLAYITRMNRLINAIKNSDKKYIIIDRSLNADLNTFTKMLYDEGSINTLEWNAYNMWNNFFYQHFGQGLQHSLIYLHCDPDVAFCRTKIRCRDEEKTIPLDYLTSLHKYHEDWINNEEKLKILRLDCNQDFVNNREIFEEMFNQFKNFLKNLNVN